MLAGSKLPIKPSGSLVALALQARFYRKTGCPSYYNRRFKPSVGYDPIYYSFASKWLPPGGAEKTRTDRNPNNLDTSNLLMLNFWEMRYLSGDYVYQIWKRLGRSNDSWTRVLGAYAMFSFMMFNQAFIWKLHLFASASALYLRIRDKGVEPQIDEINVLDTIFENETIRKYFSPETYHVIDYHQEFDEGLDIKKFPELDTQIARFFNTDAGTTTGFYKMGDVETGATMTLEFKTMPYANNRYNLSEPFLIYDLKAKILHDGNITIERIIKEEDVLAVKKIFVMWH